MERFTFLSSDGVTHLAAYRTTPENPRAMVQISHGMCEYFMRYEGFAEYLTEQGFLVFGHDHLGHGNSAPSADALGFTRSGGGYQNLIEDVHLLSQKMQEEHPTLPLILFGHSMGSFIARAVIEQFGEDYKAAIICGTGGPDTPAGAGKLLASLLMLFCGEHHRSKLLKSIAFMGYNKKFEKGCDKNAWLTRDADVIARYNADPFCTYTFTLRAYHDLFELVALVNRREWAQNIRRDLPILLVSGEMDPVGSFGKGVRAVAGRLEEAKIEDLTLILYPEMRHEILNELEKDSVWTEICQWIASKASSR